MKLSDHADVLGEEYSRIVSAIVAKCDDVYALYRDKDAIIVELGEDWADITEVLDDIFAIPQIDEYLSAREDKDEEEREKELAFVVTPAMLYTAAILLFVTSGLICANLAVTVWRILL
jgi:hypothetical protein